jgi:Tol biopolymer transport system component
MGLPAVTVALIVMANLPPPAASQELLRVAEASAPRSKTGDRAETRDVDACEIKELKKSEIQGVKVSFPDGSRFLINREDENEVAQVYVGTGSSSAHRCITCTQQPGGPKPGRFKMQPHWHPSGDWIFMAVERENYNPPPILRWSKAYVEGQLQCGLWTNMYAVSADGKRWHRLTDFKSNVAGVPDGYTGPVFTPDGRRAVWSQVIDGNIFRYWPFGRWELILADFEVRDGIPRMVNQRDITPEGMHWNEIGNFGPDNASLLISGSTEEDAQGMDQYILNIDTGELTNLTNSPTVWDEHGLFSPDGEKLIFMSAYPYRAKPRTSKVLTIKTEFMLMNRDGTGLTQLTHFHEPGHPEYSKRGGIAGAPEWSHDGRSVNLSQLFFPNFEYWDIEFEGPCGRSDLLAAWKQEQAEQ